MKRQPLWMKKFDLVKLEFKTATWPRNSNAGFVTGLGLMARALNSLRAEKTPDRELMLRWERLNNALKF